MIGEIHKVAAQTENGPSWFLHRDIKLANIISGEKWR